ncbi:integrase [Caballeronia cordobensis]|nr:integrase [Burkholderia sp. RPE67]
MAARKRIAGRRLFPPNLYMNGAGYYWYRNPYTKETFGMGTDFKVASDQAKAANAVLAARHGDLTLVQRMSGGGMSLADYCIVYQDERLGGKPNTVRSMKSQIAAICADPCGKKSIATVMPKDVADMVKRAVVERGENMAGKIRKRVQDVFRQAIENGLVEVGKNPADAVVKPKSEVRRSRLTLDEFKAILTVAREDAGMRWMANAIELALVSGQRREDIVAMTFAQVKEGFLWVEQTKGREGNKAKVRIPLDLQLAALDVTLGDVLKRCRDSVVSKHVIHFIRQHGAARAGQPPKLGTVSDVFSAMRDAAGIKPEPGRTPPTFHEIRSLAARLYTEQYGKEVAQAILGHKSEKMTSLYRDVRGREWVEVKLKAG